MKNIKQGKPIKKAANASAGKNKEAKKSASRLMTALVAGVILMVTYFTFSPSLKCEFTNWDDPTYVLENPLLERAAKGNIKEIFTTKEVSLNYHPLTILSLARDYSKAKLGKPEVYHLTNLIFHLLNTLLVFVFIYFLSTGKILVAGITALLFGIHPMHVESVTWIAERKDVLYTFFFLSSLILYLKYSESKKVWLYLATLFVFILSLLSKGMAVTLPVIMLLMDYFTGRKLESKVWLEKIPFFLLSFTFGYVALKIQNEGAIASFGTFTLFERIMFASYAAVMYLVKLFVPVNLSAFYPYPITDKDGIIPILFYLMPFIFLAIASVTIWSLKKGKLLFFGFAFYFVSVALVLQFISVGSAIMAERYTYVAYIGPFFIIASLLQNVFETKNYSLSKVRWLIFGVVAIAVITFSKITYARTQVWTNSLTLWNDVLKQFPKQSTALNNRGKYYGKDLGGQYAGKDQAVFNAYLDSAMTDLSAAIKYDLNYEKAFNNRGIVFSIRGKFDSAIADFSSAIRLKPDYYEAVINRGITYAQTSRHEKAIEDFSKALLLQRKSNDFMNRGLSYSKLNQLQNALDDFNAALSSKPDNMAAIYLNRSEVFYKLKKYHEAFADVQFARNAGLNVPDAYYKQLQDAAAQ